MGSLTNFPGTGSELYKGTATFRQVTVIRYRGADKSLTRPTSRSILFDGENISFDASLVIYINSNNIPQIMIINRIYRGADKSLARPTSRCILFDGENISFDASLVIHRNITNIPQIMIINRIYRGADKSLARPTSRCILFDGENISFDASLKYI